MTKPTQPTEKICFRYDGSEEAKEGVFIKCLNKENISIGNFITSDAWIFINEPYAYRLVTPAEFLRIVKGEPEWKLGDECEYDGLPVGTIRTGQIIAIYQNVAWIKISEIQNPITLSLSALRPLRKSLREEIVHLVAQHHKKQYQIITDEIIQLIKERRNEL